MSEPKRTGLVSAVHYIQDPLSSDPRVLTDSELDARYFAMVQVHSRIRALGPGIVALTTRIDRRDTPMSATPYIEVDTLAAYRDWRECPVGEYALRPSGAGLELIEDGVVLASFVVPEPLYAQYSPDLVQRIS